MAPVLAVAAFAVILTAACDDAPSDGAGGAGGAGGAESPPIVTELHPNAPPLPGFSTCDVVITENAKFEGQTHQPVCTALDYTSNPPTSGNHWPVWAKFQSYDQAVPREMLVHDLEHGAMVMLFKCATACPDVVAALEGARTKFGTDPLCVMTNPAGPPARFVVSPDPKLATPIAISGWRASYTATCIDPPSLQDFVTKHYGKGPEQVCADGKDPFDPLSGIACE